MAPPTGERRPAEESGGAIHGVHPFLSPDSERNPVRRLRGRLTSPVTLWTAVYDNVRAGLPVSSMLVVEGDPGQATGHVIGLVDPASEFWDAASESGRFAVALLEWEHRALADAFGGLGPAPGGPFRMTDWADTEWGPVPASASTWAGCVVTDTRMVGYSMVVEATLAHIELGEDGEQLLHRRGRYFHL